MARLKDDWYHLVPDSIVLRTLGQRVMLGCMCCGMRYERGQFRCCAPPNNMASHHWLAMACPPKDQGGCGKCAKHCQCPNKQQRLGEGPLARMAEDFRSDPVQFSREHGED